eukprot:4957540-Amphidinium_carterae.1
MLVELRMRDEEQRAKQLVLRTGTAQAASEDYKADQWTWTAEKWAEYKAKAAGQAKPAQSKAKICSAHASKKECPKEGCCVMAAKGGHLECGINAYNAEQRATCTRHAHGHLGKARTRPSNNQNWYVIDAAAAKGKAKGKGMSSILILKVHTSGKLL